MDNNDSVEHILDTSDPGDDVGLRFQYQYAYAAINGLKTTDDSSDVELVICENHEDFVIKRRSGKFVAVQVKTRNLDLDPFKANDQAVEHALAKFCNLNHQYPDQFEAFRFVTNHRFWSKEADHRNLPWLISEISRKPSVKGLHNNNPRKAFVSKIASKTGLSFDQVIATLVSIKLDGRNEPVERPIRVLVDALGETSFGDSKTYSELNKIANVLMLQATHASTKGLSGNSSDLYDATRDFSETIESMTLAGKVLNKQKVEKIIDSAVTSLSSPISVPSIIPAAELPADLVRMYKKLDRGELQKARVDAVADYVRSFQHLELGWAQKYGSEQAREWSIDLLAKVMNDCAEAEATVTDTSKPYGSEKYSNLKKELEKRQSTYPDTMRGSSLEHMLGAAGVLTEQCKVWWSPPFKIEVDEANDD